MMEWYFRKIGTLALVVAVMLGLAFPAMADKPSSNGGNGKSGKHVKKEKNNGNEQSHYGSSEAQSGYGVTVYFDDHRREVVRNYYREEYRSGHCPPGLAKKNNGCMPPGQAKKWRKGHSLPHDVVYYDLPPAVVIELGAPPSGHKYVRVASDILLMAVGTGMIVDAIQDLGDM